MENTPTDFGVLKVINSIILKLDLGDYFNNNNTIIFHVNNIMIMMMIINSITLICKMCRIHIYIYLYIYIYTLFHGKNAWMIFIHKLLYTKKQTSEYSEQMSFLMHCNQWLKIIQALSMVWCFFNFIHTMIFSRWTIHFKDWKPFAALNCEALSFVSLIGRTIQFSQSFVQYVWNKYSFIYCSWSKFHNCRDK